MELSKIPEIKFYKKMTIDDRCSLNVIKESKKYKNLEIISIMYKSDNLKIHGYILKHKNCTKKLPVIMYCRGGNNHPIENNSYNTKPGEYYSRVPNLCELVNNNKIIIFASNYRGSVCSEGVDEFGGKDVNDVINLYPIIKKYKYSNEKQIGIYAISRGCMTALITHKLVNWIKCLVLIGGNYDLLRCKTFRPDMYKFLTKIFKFSKKDLQDRSAINWVNKLPKTSPILLLHGTSDWQVSVESSLELGIKLYKHKIPYKLIVYPGQDHGLSGIPDETALDMNRFYFNYLFENKPINLEFWGK